MTTANEHFKATVMPVWDEKGLCPEFAAMVDAHVAQFGSDFEVWNHFGDADGRNPRWFDGQTQRVRPLKMTWQVCLDN